MTKQTQKALDLIEEVFNELWRDPLQGKPEIARTRNALRNIYRLLGKGHISVPRAISEVKHLPYSARNPYSMGVILQLRNSLMHTQQSGGVDQEIANLISDVFDVIHEDVNDGMTLPGAEVVMTHLTHIRLELEADNVGVYDAIAEIADLLHHRPVAALAPYIISLLSEIKDLPGELISDAEFEEMWKDYTDSLGSHTPQQDNIMHSKVDKTLDEPIDVTTKPKTIVEQMENYRKDCPEGGKCEPGDLLIFGMEFCKKCVRSMD